MARRALTAAVVVATAVVAVTGCSGPSGGSSGSSSAPGKTLVAGAKGSAAAEKALAATAVQLRQQVALATAPIKASVAGEQVTVDASGPCEVATTTWPMRWGYSLQLTLSTTDPVAVAKLLSGQLASQGWSIQAHPGTADVADFDARKGAVRLRVSGEPNPSTVAIEGYGACVGADGKVSAS